MDTLLEGFRVPGCNSTSTEFRDKDDFDFVTSISVPATVIGLIIMVGTVLSVIPQYIKLFMKRDSSGLSPFYLLIQIINQVTTVANASMTNATYIHSCYYVGFSMCFPWLVSFIQIVLLAMVYLPQIVFYLIFYPNKKDWKYFKIPLIASPFLVILSAAVFGTVPLLEFTDGECGDVTFAVSFAYGMVSTVCVIIQWSPQIFMTFRRRSAGALSVVMLCITAPGMTVLTLYMIFITGQSFSTWASNAASAIQQLILLVLCIYFEYIAKCFKGKDTKSESKPLLDNAASTRDEANGEDSPVADVSEL